MSVEYPAGAHASRSSVPIQESPIATSPKTESWETTADLPAVVSAIGEIRITGNLIPSAWYQQLKLPSGRPDLVSCTLLGEIVYQYRPQPVRDEVTGEILHYVKRFARDQFCAPVAYFTGKFGLTPDQVRQGLRRLETAGFITREYRSIKVAGREVHGMTFVVPVPAAIDRITRAFAGTIRPGNTPRLEESPSVSIPEGVVGKPEGAVCTPLYKDSSISPQDKPTPPPTSPQSMVEPTLPSSERCCRDSVINTNEVLIPSSISLPKAPELPHQPTPSNEPTQLKSPIHGDESPANRDNGDPTPLVFDFHLAPLSEQEKTEFQHRLTRLPAPLNQRVLDEYNSALGGGKPIRNKWSWLEYLIRKAIQGEFIPTSELAERRQALADARAVSEQKAEPERVPSLVWRSYREALKPLVEPEEYHAYVLPLRGIEEGDRLWLEAPNNYIVDWVKAHWVIFEQTLKPHTGLVLGIRVEMV
ncbi:MAG: DnaA N-terminal domain-containing protein [Candidatus Competibacteraceae bacterium]|jgi:hypothetical protein|nr:DnaA N-terminal domain-containing protein [Candidatus Competibacteraceae bacterium]